jgi:CRP-like cAMP-binding protein
MFLDISATDCTAILVCAHERHFSRRQVIFLAGDPIRHTLLLTSGTVKVTQSGQNGGEVILRLNGEGESVGALGMCTRGEHCASVKALENCTALLWEASTFETLAERYPILRRNLIRILEIRLQEIDARFRKISTEKGFIPLEQRDPPAC